MTGIEHAIRVSMSLGDIVAIIVGSVVAGVLLVVVAAVFVRAVRR